MSARINLGTYDAETLLHKPTTAAITTSGAGVVGVAAKVIDLGDAKAAWTAKQSLKLLMLLLVQTKSTSSIFRFLTTTSPLTSTMLPTLELGDAAQLVGDTDLASGRFELPFCNVHNGVVKRYVRTFATSYKCFIAQLPCRFSQLHCVSRSGLTFETGGGKQFPLSLKWGKNESSYRRKQSCCCASYCLRPAL